jgi:hypothetical protein
VVKVEAATNGEIKSTAATESIIIFFILCPLLLE